MKRTAGTSRLNIDKYTIKGLFVTFEGIGDTIFDSQVALHAREMKKYGVELEIWVFETWPGMWAKSKARLNKARKLSRSEVRLFRGAFYYLPFSEIINALLLTYHLRRLRPNASFIHARADYAAAVAGLASQNHHMPIIWDCRGDAEAEFKTAYQPRHIGGHLFKFVFSQLTKWRTSIAAQKCAGAIFVSEELRRRKWKYASYKPSEVIPTSVAQDIFFFSRELRDKMRRQLSLTSGQLVLLYSGSIVSYQGFENYVRLFSTLLTIRNDVYFLVITPHIKKAKQMIRQLPSENWAIYSASIEEMNAYYNAADFGLLIRERNSVNDVASPTKFGEYSLTGLPVIMNDSVKQSYQFARDFGNLVEFHGTASSIRLIPRTPRERLLISKRAAEVLSRESTARRYLNIYSQVLERV